MVACTSNLPAQGGEQGGRHRPGADTEAVRAARTTMLAYLHRNICLK